MKKYMKKGLIFLTTIICVCVSVFSSCKKDNNTGQEPDYSINEAAHFIGNFVSLNQDGTISVRLTGYCLNEADDTEISILAESWEEAVRLFKSWLPDNVSVNSPARPGTPQTAKGSAAMNKKPASKNTGLVILGVVAAIMISAAAEDPDAIIPAVITIGVVAAIVGVVKAMSKEKAGKTGKKTNVELHRPFPQPTVVKTKQTPRTFRHKDEAEEAITCAHHSGKEKYLEQVEGFYRNGLIDRAEYKALREKYEKMDIPEDYH